MKCRYPSSLTKIEVRVNKYHFAITLKTYDITLNRVI